MKGGFIWTSCVLCLTVALGCGGDRRSGGLPAADRHPRRHRARARLPGKPLLVLHVQHHWVTESGDTLSFDQATATTTAVAPGLYAIITYLSSAYGLALSLAVLGFNLFGDTLRDAWDPKLRRQG